MKHRVALVAAALIGFAAAEPPTAGPIETEVVKTGAMETPQVSGLSPCTCAMLETNDNQCQAARTCPRGQAECVEKALGPALDRYCTRGSPLDCKGCVARLASTNMDASLIKTCTFNETAELDKSWCTPQQLSPGACSDDVKTCKVYYGALGVVACGQELERCREAADAAKCTRTALEKHLDSLLNSSCEEASCRAHRDCVWENRIDFMTRVDRGDDIDAWAEMQACVDERVPRQKPRANYRTFKDTACAPNQWPANDCALRWINCTMSSPDGEKCLGAAGSSPAELPAPPSEVSGDEAQLARNYDDYREQIKVACNGQPCANLFLDCSNIDLSVSECLEVTRSCMKPNEPCADAGSFFENESKKDISKICAQAADVTSCGNFVYRCDVEKLDKTTRDFNEGQISMGTAAVRVRDSRQECFEKYRSSFEETESSHGSAVGEGTQTYQDYEKKVCDGGCPFHFWLNCNVAHVDFDRCTKLTKACQKAGDAATCGTYFHNAINSLVGSKYSGAGVTTPSVCFWGVKKCVNAELASIVWNPKSADEDAAEASKFVEKCFQKEVEETQSGQETPPQTNSSVQGPRPPAAVAHQDYERASASQAMSQTRPAPTPMFSAQLRPCLLRSASPSHDPSSKTAGRDETAAKSYCFSSKIKSILTCSRKRPILAAQTHKII